MILTSPSGGVMPLMGNEYELAMFETELLAKDAVLDNGLDDSFGFEIFKLDKDEKKQPRKRDEGDYIAAARKETFEKLEPLRKVLFNIARDSEVNCNTKNCMLYSSKAEQNCNGINSGVSPSINDCPKYTPEVIRDGLYPCDDCGKMRTKAQGGTTFTICDVCWDKRFKHPQPPGDAQ